MAQKSYEIITSFYYSNCLVEALKAKMRDPNIKLYICLPYRRQIKLGVIPIHVMWEDSDYSYDFSDDAQSDSNHSWQYIWYKGAIRRWPKTFAREFSRKRNILAKRSWGGRRRINID